MTQKRLYFEHLKMLEEAKKRDHRKLGGLSLRLYSVLMREYWGTGVPFLASKRGAKS